MFRERNSTSLSDGLTSYVNNWEVQTMVNNPMMQVLQLMRNGGNPMMMLNQMTGNNPMVSTNEIHAGQKPGRAAADGNEHCKGTRNRPRSVCTAVRHETVKITEIFIVTLFSGRCRNGFYRVPSGTNSFIRCTPCNTKLFTPITYVFRYSVYGYHYMILMCWFLQRSF